MCYAELHCHSNFSLLDGAAHPEDLAAQAAEHGLSALAITDHDGLYGAVRFAKACPEAGVKPIIGAELTLEGGHHLVLLAENNAGYSNLCRLISHAQLTHGKGQVALDWETLARHSGHLIYLSGCRRGELAAQLLAGRPGRALAAARRYREVFGPQRCYVELQRHFLPDDARLGAGLSDLARRLDLGLVATNNVHYATRDGHRLQDVLVCIRTHTSLDQSHALRRTNAEYYLKSPSEMAALFADQPEALANTLRIAERCAVSLDFRGYRFPPFPAPPGETPFSYLHQLCHQGALERYRPITPQVVRQLAHELTIIDKLGLSEYFLAVWDIMRYAREQGILGQGRGSAANSIVAYCLGITNVDPLRLDLLFERFLSEERAGTPDIDIDFANSHREQIIQYVYQKYGPEYTAMVCTVITFQARSAVRDVGKALGMPLHLVDRLAKEVDRGRWAREPNPPPPFPAREGGGGYSLLHELCRQIDGFPRHLSIHVGGMLITATPLVEVVPLEKATMPGRVVTQYDKDDVEDVGLVKIDILALGMLALIQECLALIRRHRGKEIDLARLPLDDTQVYDMLCAADTIGLFQVESRAQMATLPRLQPRNFYDIITEIAIIRPGPIQGHMVHPFLRRRRGEEEVSYLHPCLEPILAKTLGVPLFQEQVIRIASVAAGFSPGEADLLRRAMGSHRSHSQMEKLRRRFIEGAAAQGIAAETAVALFQQLEGFAEYGFPESHAAAFAKIVYDSAYLKRYYAPEFYCALLNNQPMGFYQPAVIVNDAQRHGVPVLRVDVNRSRGRCTVEGEAVRLGFRYVRGIGEMALATLDSEAANGPYRSLLDFCRRSRLDREAVANLIQIGACDTFGLPRRRLLWQLPGVLQAVRAGELSGLQTAGLHEVEFPEVTPVEEASADYYILGLSPSHHPIAFCRPALDRQGVYRADEVAGLPAGLVVKVAGHVICRQRPGTAGGHVFLTIEDETGLANVIVRPQVYEQQRALARNELLLIVEGVVQRQDSVVSLLAKRFFKLDVPMPGMQSRDFR